MSLFDLVPVFYSSQQQIVQKKHIWSMQQSISFSSKIFLQPPEIYSRQSSWVKGVQNHRKLLKVTWHVEEIQPLTNEFNTYTQNNFPLLSPNLPPSDASSCLRGQYTSNHHGPPHWPPFHLTLIFPCSEDNVWNARTAHRRLWVSALFLELAPV